MITEQAPAKVNLYLQITGKREDGYHLLDSLVVFPPVGDVLQVEEAEPLSLDISGPFSDGLQDGLSDNLVLKAAQLLRDHCKIEKGARISLIKNLPLASGIGGGSADAAACLRALNQLWGLDLPLKTLAKLGLSLGADLPACIYSTPLRMRGIGEEIDLEEGFSLPPMLLVNPGVEVPTPSIFKAMTPENWSGEAHDPLNFGALTNDMQSIAVNLQPVIGDVLDRLSNLPGVTLSRMSGSGATCFALFSDQNQLISAAEMLKSEMDWIVLTDYPAQM